MIKEAIALLADKQDLSFKITEEVFKEIFEQKATSAQIASFLSFLRAKGETEEEISAAAGIVRSKATKIKARSELLGIEDTDECIMDTCGTGGSGANKFNISTTVAFIVAASGIKVAKHGNRAMSSQCGSADILEELGVRVDVNPQVMEDSIHKTGICFLFAPLYHPALKEVAAIRKEIGVKTVFNVLGPLCNPAAANYQLLGVYSPKLIPILARVLRNLGTKRAMVIYGQDFKDEVSLTGKTIAAFLNNKKIEKMIIKPSDFGFKKISLSQVQTSGRQQNSKLVQEVLNGKKGPARDMVLANAACCFFVLGKAKTLKEGVKIAAAVIDSGAAKNKLREFKEFVDQSLKV